MNEDILFEAVKCGWRRVAGEDLYLTSFRKVISKSRVRINVWINKKDNTFTVGVCLKHPKRGRCQLFRRRCSVGEVKLVLGDPIVHTQKGYS